jgi:hypothetical protein
VEWNSFQFLVMLLNVSDIIAVRKAYFISKCIFHMSLMNNLVLNQYVLCQFYKSFGIFFMEVRIYFVGEYRRCDLLG